MSDLDRSPADRLPAEVRAAVAAATPARLFLPGSPLGYPTRSWLSLRADHAAARDAVASTLELDDPALADFVARHDPLELHTAVTAEQHLARPDLGRVLSPASRQQLETVFRPVRPATLGSVPASGGRGTVGPGTVGRASLGRATLGLALGDGLSATAARLQGPAMVDALVAGAGARGWTMARPLLIHRCRVGVLNELGPLLGVDVVILLVGERPGLAVADSLSAYLAWRPQPGHTDARRNLVSGIHDRGTPPAAAAVRVLDLVARLLAAQTSGVGVKEELAPTHPGTLGPG